MVLATLIQLRYDSIPRFITETISDLRRPEFALTEVLFTENYPLPPPLYVQ